MDYGFSDGHANISQEKAAYSAPPEELVPDKARRWRQSDAAWFAPERPVDLFFVTDHKSSPCLLSDEDRIVHLTA